MASFGTVAWSSVGKKVITGITGLALMGFVTVHLVGNLTLFIGPDAFNGYAHFLETMLHGWFIYAFEIVMLAIFLFHMISTFFVAWTDKRKARSEGYKYARNAGGKSRKTLASTTMIYTGALLITFVIAHIWLFKFGSHEVYTAHGTVMKNIYKTVVETYKEIPFTVFTVVVMGLLGFHLRHGFWSAFQSLGWANDKYLPILTRIALVYGVLMAVSFIGIPVYMFLFGDPNLMPGGH